MSTIPAFPGVGLLVVFSCISIALSTILYSNKKLNTITFAIANILASIWILTNTVLLPLKSISLDLLVNVSFSSAYSTLLFIWYFVYYYGDFKKTPSERRVNKLVSILGFILAFLSISTQLIVSKTYYIGDSLILEFGPLYLVGTAYFVSLFIAICIQLIKRRRVADGPMKKQLGFFLIGFLITTTISLLTNLILPPITGDSNSSRIGPLGMFFFLAFSFYAIVRHRFLDIRLLIGRIIYFTTLITLPYIMFYSVAYIYIRLFGDVFRPETFLISLIPAYIFVIIFDKVINYTRTQVNSRLINPGYNPLETVEKLTNQLSVMIDLTEIANSINSTIAKAIRPDYAAIVIFKDKDRPNDLVLPSMSGKSFANLDDLKSTIITLWRNVGKHPIIQDQIQVEIMDGIYRNIPHIVNQLEQLMIDNGIKVILGIGQDESIIGLFFVGQKEADSAYTSIDVDFLKSVTNTGASAIQRSLLYNEVQEFNRTLQKRVDEATSALKTSNAELARTLEQVQELRRQERDMVDIMGHELRTPISIVRNALVMLQMQVKNSPDPKIIKYVEMGLESARREIKLIETLLSATKVEGNRIQLDFTRVDLIDVINDAIEGNKAMAKGKSLEILYTPPSESVYVYCDRVRIQEVMDNFLSNALKYTPKGSVAININVDKAKSMAFVSVKDSGIGIAPEDLERLGRKFFRAKQYVSKDGKSEESVVRPGGTGLGLYVTFEFIRLMGGERNIESKVGEGSTFSFGMPLFTGQADKHIDQTFMPGQNYGSQAQSIIPPEPAPLEQPKLKQGINLLKGS